MELSDLPATAEGLVVWYLNIHSDEAFFSGIGGIVACELQDGEGRAAQLVPLIGGKGLIIDQA